MPDTLRRPLLLSLMGLGLFLAIYIDSWGNLALRLSIDAVALGLVALRPRLLVLIPCFIYTQHIAHAVLRSWWDWGEKSGDTILLFIFIPLVAMLLLERGPREEPWYRRPAHRPEILAVAILGFLAIAGAIGDRTAQGQRLGMYLWPFLALCMIQAFRPLPTAAGTRRLDALGQQRHWFLTLLVSVTLVAYFFYGSLGDVVAWRYYTETHVLPIAVIAFVVFRAFPPRPLVIPGVVRMYVMADTSPSSELSEDTVD